ncbi:MAG: GNAT family N-acetyltransferase [Clostridia bacterium]|nr:GNAT family N-acetyltransferase [Clostridia bacterium]
MNGLTTPRLIVRRFRPADWRDLQEYVSRPEVMWFERDWETSDEACRRQAEKLAENEAFRAVELRGAPDAGKMIGHVYFERIQPEDFMTWELGYIFNNRFHGHGYATEACRAVLDDGFRRLGIHRVAAKCALENPASWRLMERLGMRREGLSPKAVTFRRTEQGQPIWWDELTYAVLADEWPVQGVSEPNRTSRS